MQSILVAVDFSDVTDRVIAKAGELARATGAKVWLAHVVTDATPVTGMGDLPMPGTLVDDDLPRHFPSEQARLRDIVASLQDIGVIAEQRLVSGDAVERIVNLAAEYEADMIVMGSHGHGALYELIVGTVSEGVMRHTTRPVLIVPSVAPPKRKSQPQRQVPIATPY